MKSPNDEGPKPPLAVTKARENFSDMINRVVYRHERIVLGRRGKNVAALVPMEDLELLEKLEEQADVELVRRVRRQIRSGKEKPVPWAKAKKQLGF